MTATTIRVQMAQRKDTAANWTAANPILLSGEIGYETDTKKFKIGNGSTNWNSLAYLPIPDGSGNLTITGNLEIGSTGSLTFEGSTADGFETTLAVTNPTADRTITLPNQSGTVLVSGNASIVDADIAANAEIAVSKLADGTARQLLQTDAAGAGVEWTSNVDVPGTLDVTSTATFDSIAQHPLGTAGAPTITFTGDNNTGIYSPGADQVAISTNGTGKLFVDANGNVGVNISPSARFHVVDTDSSSAYDANAILGTQTSIYKQIIHTNQSSGTNEAGLVFRAGTSSNIAEWGISTQRTGATSGDLIFRTRTGASTSKEFFRITSTGTVNIVGAGSAGSTQAVSFNGSAPVNSLVIDSSGRLLVGTSSSIANALEGAVQIVGTAADAYLTLTRFGGPNTSAPAGIILGRSRSETKGTNTAVSDGDFLGVVEFTGADGGSSYRSAAQIGAYVDGVVSGGGAADMPGRLVFSTTADGASSPTERMRITSAGKVNVYGSGTQGFLLTQFGTNYPAYIYEAGAGGQNAAATQLVLHQNSATGRSLNAAGTINASGADYAEYMVKAGDFSIAKGAICGITADGLLTLNYADAVSFVVKSTNPSYVGGDTWGAEDAVGPKPNADDFEALAQWESNLETARQQVDRIAFAGQVPVNITGATPGQYIVPVEAADGGIKGVANDQADLTLAEYMRAVGKVIAIEDDGRARIIVKVA